jgi:hypothetical protein
MPLEPLMLHTRGMWDFKWPKLTGSSLLQMRMTWNETLDQVISVFETVKLCFACLNDLPVVVAISQTLTIWGNMKNALLVHKDCMTRVL